MAISEQQFQDLERRLKSLEDYVAQRKIQQIRFPLDPASQKVIIDIIP